MTTSQMSLWNESTTTWPRVFEAGECWEKRSPTSEEFIFETLDLISARKLAEKRNKVDDYQVYIALYSQGIVDSDLDPRKAIAQLHEPDRLNPVGLIGYRLPKLIPDDNPGFVTPVALSRVVEPFNEHNRQVLCTPKFWMTDLHIDNCDGLSATIGSYGQRSKLARIGKDLEGGLVIKADSTQALYVPAGCIHAVFTLHGGFLVSLEFTTSLSVKVLSALLNAQFDRFKDQWLQSELPRQFIESVELALTQNQVLVGVDAWINAQDRIRLWYDKEQDSNDATRNQYWADRRPDWEKEVRSVWGAFFRSPYSGAIEKCLCKGMIQGRYQTFKEHFYLEHLVVDRLEQGSGATEIIEPKPKRRKKRM
ncbi:hypothetical protein ACEPPN_008450 [Leptodophora sp. 'Broadleaf-Isolate-01']